METKKNTRVGKTIVTVLIVLVVIAVLGLSMHMLANSLDFAGLIRSIHGG